jgi:hypothetical protein
VFGSQDHHKHDGRSPIISPLPTSKYVIPPPNLQKAGEEEPLVASSYDGRQGAVALPLIVASQQRRVSMPRQFDRKILRGNQSEKSNSEKKI